MRNILLFFVLCLGIPVSAYGAETVKPAVLIDSWGADPDLKYMGQLQALGLEVDAINHDQLTWERLKQFHVLVMVDFPQEGEVKLNPWHGPATGPNFSETIALIDKFLAAGGGVMLNLEQHDNRPELYNVTQKALARWGARRPQESVVLPADQIVIHPRLRMPFFHITQIEPSPVSAGVSSVWYPQGVPWIFAAGPIDVDNSWTVVLRGPTGSRSQPIALPESKPGIVDYEKPFVRSEGVAQPPLFAIRELAAGRLALLHAHSNFHFGSGHSWLHDGVMLDQGLQGTPSDFGKLLTNTFRWLAEPAMQGHTLGGATTPAQRWIRPLEKTTSNAYQRYLGTEPPLNLDPALAPTLVQMFKGMIGPRTTYSGGSGSVAEYAVVAKEKNLSFVIFLEDMAQLSPEKLALLVADCRSASTKDLLLIAGYRAQTNLGNQMFFFGADPLFIHDKYLSADKKILMLQPQAVDGTYSSSRFIDFVFQHKGTKDLNSVGFFDFTVPMKTGGMAMPDLRLFSMAGVVSYKNGKLIEDVSDQYLLTNAGTMTGTPVAINMVDSPEALRKEVDAGHALTYAAANSVENLWVSALRWNHTYMAPNVYPSTGPHILHWPDGFYRTGTYAGELGVAKRMLVAPHLQVTADSGLKEISLYDGTRLFRRFLPGGAKEFSTRLFMSGSLQRNISVVAIDMKGGKAISFPLRGWNDGSPAAVYCADHVNDGTMKSFRGPTWSRYTSYPLISEPGRAWDGMNLTATQPAIDIGILLPSFSFNAGIQSKNIYQTSVMEASDDRVWRGRSLSRGIILPGVPHLTPWSGFGPIEPVPFVSMVGIFTEWARYQTPSATDWGAKGLEGGPSVSHYTQMNTFQKDAVLTNADLSYCWRKGTTSPLYVLTGDGDTVRQTFNIGIKDMIDTTQNVRQRIATGSWFAVISSAAESPLLFVNHGAPLRLEITDKKTSLVEDVPAEGLSVKAGDTREIAWFTCWWPVDGYKIDQEELLRAVRYLQNPKDLNIVRGTRTARPIGPIEIATDRQVAEFTIPRAPVGMDPNLPFTVTGMNQRWSTVLWQQEGYLGGARYHTGTDRFRNLAVDDDGRSRFPIPTGQAARHQVQVGHPVIADSAGKDLFIEVVCLKDREAAHEPVWHVSVNNPTDQDITTTISQNMHLPGLSISKTPVTVKSGSYILLVHAQ